MSDSVIKFVIIGTKNSGKTVFLSTLFGKEEAFASANKETAEYLKANWKKLQKGETPSATSSRIIQLRFQYKTREHSLRFSIDDYDGYFVETLSDEDEHTQTDRDTLKKHIKGASGLLFLCPYEKQHDEGSLERFRYEIDTFIQLIKEIYPDRKNLPIPTVIAVSKWDQCRYFKAQDEFQRAEDYIESVEDYRIASSKIKTFFADVKVIPISAFGVSIDGLHPINGKIEPHHLSEPFNHLLNVTFHKFEEKVSKLRAEKKTPELFKFLSTIYNDAKFYKDGKLIKAYETVENQYASELIEKLENAPNPNEQENILNEHIFLYENLRNKEFVKKIRRLVKSKKAKTRKKKVLVCLLLLLLAGLSAYGTLAFRAYEEERNAFVAIQGMDPKEMPEETDLLTIALSGLKLGVGNAEDTLPPPFFQRGEREQGWKREGTIAHKLRPPPFFQRGTEGDFSGQVA